MAYASLVSLEQTTYLSLNHHKYSISVDEREIITSIHEYVILLISFLENVPEKVNRLEGEIRDLANEAEDLIEYFMRNQFQMDWSVGLWRAEFERQLKRVREKIGSVTGDMMDDRLCDLPAAISSSRLSPTSKNDVVVGLYEDLIAIKCRLCGESSKLEVIPVVGMGGIGKTTLARNAYNDPLIMEYFDIRIWVTVSHSTVDEILSRLVSVRFLDKHELSMEERVYRSLKGMRYLIVMDDVWSTKAWGDVRNILPDDKNGSRIMLTTRLLDVATYASSGNPPHEMKFMDEDHSWNLLERKVFTDGQGCPAELENIGKEISRGCRGLPLAVVLVAGILSTIDKTRASWEKIAKNVNSVVDEQLDKILSLSYTFLPHHLRSCFLFMAGFPDDHTINVSRLIKLWVAEGFLKRQNGCKSLEEEAEECLEDLVKRSLVLITSRTCNGKIKSCNLHDLVRDLCIRKAQEEMFLLTSRFVLPNGRKDERRISIAHSNFDKILSPTMRTILCFRTFLYCSSLTLLENFKLLRVLDIIHGNNVLLPHPNSLSCFF
ncbi:hypothetical protein ACS0TY_004793 [Phlomoides rotata]